MWRRTWRIWILVGLVVCGTCSTAEGAQEPTAEGVTIAVHNDARVPVGSLVRAEQTASWVFKEAGLDVSWANCVAKLQAAEAQTEASCGTTDFPRHLQLRIVLRSISLRSEVFGVSYLGEDGTGCYSDIFLEPAEELQERGGPSPYLSLGTMLGYVVAHEIGHLLLGNNSHSSTGIMRARWDKADLERAERRQLLFTEEQSQTMRRKVLGSWTKSGTIAEVASGQRVEAWR